jgi:hypothetical protein
MKKIMTFLMMFSMVFAMGFVVADDPTQDAEVTVGEVVDCMIEDADFSTVVPGDMPTDTTTFDCSASNVVVYIEDVEISSSATEIYNSLTIEGIPYASYGDTPIPVEYDSPLDLILQITIPANFAPGTYTNTITYTYTGDAPE